jgi:hypothetical protein
MAKGRFKVAKKPPSPAQQFAFFREEVRRGMEPVADEHVERREGLPVNRHGRFKFAGETVAKGTVISTLVILENQSDSLGRYGGTVKDLWRWLNLGTKPHRIYPRFKRALRFVVDSVVVFARYVNHPGTKAQQLTLKTNQELRSFEDKQIRRSFRSAWQKLERFNKR